jgi:hypothetical protein
MKISSYNITDTSYHLIGLRVLAGLPPGASKEEQTSAISRNVLKYATDRALKLMLPSPRGNFETVGEKICNELLHFRLAKSEYSKGYELTDDGRELLSLLSEKRNIELRRKLIELHLRTYDNLRYVLQRHLELGAVFSPVIYPRDISESKDIATYLAPSFGEDAQLVAEQIRAERDTTAASKLEDVLRDRILGHLFPDFKMSVALFRSLNDRLMSLRLLNTMKDTEGEYEFAKSYSPCKASPPVDDWHPLLSVKLQGGGSYDIYLSEPDMTRNDIQEKLIECIDEAMTKLTPQAGYHDLPEVRDLVCEAMMIPEPAFDEGVNALLDRHPAPVTLGLGYERITARRKPLTRTRESTQIFNLIRRI